MSAMTAKVNDRLYKDVASKLVAELIAGKHAIGSRLPSERDLATEFDVSRPTIREAIIALEVIGLIEVRVGSGAYVVRLPQADDTPPAGLSAFELTEARLHIEGEAAAIAAALVTDADLAQIAAHIDAMVEENSVPGGREKADREFHLAIARATRNSAMEGAVQGLWDLRETSVEAALLHEKVRSANIKPVVEEHTAVLEALRARDPEAARTAMRAHLSAVLESLLFPTEERPN